MRHRINGFIVVLMGLAVSAGPYRVSADDPKDGSSVPSEPSVATVAPSQDVPEVNLLEAVRDGLVTVKAEGIGDGRMTVTLKNKSRKKLRVVLPPGIIAQGATGQFGGMGGMGGGMGGMGGGMGGMGGGMGGMMGGMGGGMGGMGGGMGGMGGMSGGMGGMGGMGRQAGTMPPTMGMMMLSRMIMYFCGDPDSWDPRSIMIGMMGGGMGGMGGGMMGGMGGGGMGGMGGMGGGMRSVPPTDLPSAVLNPGQTRNLPTRLVSVSSPDPDAGLSFPAKGEKLRIVGDIDRLTDDANIQKALKRLTSEKAPTPVSQLVMWRIAAGLDWDTISRMSEKWANAYELTLAKSFVEGMDKLGEGESGHLLLEITGTDDPADRDAAELKKTLRGMTVLGLVAQVGQVPVRPDGPAIACKVSVSGREAVVQIASSDGDAERWVSFGKFGLKLTRTGEKIDSLRFADGLAEGLLSRLVRAQLLKGASHEKGKLVYQLRVDNASPWILNGIAVVGTVSKPDDTPQILPMLSVSPRRSFTVPATEDMVKSLGLKKGIKVVALDLSGL
jgi:hypothetical protein